MGKEKREVERVRASLPVNWGDTKICLLSGKITSLSIKGCFLQTEFEHLAQKTIFISNQLKNKKWILMQGEVVYHLDKIGLGVQFKELSYENKLILANLVESSRQQILQDKD